MKDDSLDNLKSNKIQGGKHLSIIINPLYIIAYPLSAEPRYHPVSRVVEDISCMEDDACLQVKIKGVRHGMENDRIRLQ
jgi:hypothetical protein